MKNVTLPVEAFRVMEGKAKKDNKPYKFVQLDQVWMNNDPFIDMLKENGVVVGNGQRGNNKEELPFVLDE